MLGRHWSFLLFAFTVFAALAGPIGSAFAQSVTHGPRPFICTPPNCPTDPPPTASISPGSETVATSSVAVTITLCDTLSFSADTVWLNGTNVTSSFSSTSGSGGSGCHAKLTLTHTVALNLGANTLKVDVWSVAGSTVQSGTATVTYTYSPNYGPPTASISPGTETVSSSSITPLITLCDTVSISADTVWLNGTNITSSFSTTTSSASGCAYKLQLTRTLTLVAGANTLKADVWSTAGGTTRSGTATVTYTLDTYGVTVTALQAVLPWVAPNQAGTAKFTVKNTGNVSNTFTVAASCSGVAIASCGTPSPSNPTLAAGAVDTISLAYTESNSPTGNGLVGITVTGTNASGSASSTVDASVIIPDFAALNLGDMEMRSCAQQCFGAELRLSTVPYQSLGASRNVTLVYSGDAVAVRPFISMDFHLATSAPYQPTEYQLQAKVNGALVTFINGEQTLHFAPNNSLADSVQRRVVGQFNASGMTNAAYPIQIILTAVFSDHSEQWVDSTHQLAIADNRGQASTNGGFSVARGWGIAGLLRHYWQSSGQQNYIIDTQSDGSSRVWGPVQCFAWGCTWPSPAGVTGVFKYLNATPNTSEIDYPDSSKEIYNPNGYMIARMGPHADTVQYTYDAQNRVIAISDPFRMYSGAHTYTVLKYGSYGIDSIIEPGANGAPGAGRVTAITVASDSTLRSWADPDGVTTTLAYDAAKRLAYVVGRNGDTTTYVYRSDSSWKLASIQRQTVLADLGGGTMGNARPTVTYAPWWVSLSPTTPTGSLTWSTLSVAKLTSTVTDAGGHQTTFTSDSWGQPLVTTDPVGRVTTVRRNGRYPWTITHPNGATDTLIYNATGKATYAHLAGKQPVTMTYDAFNRMTSMSAPGLPTSIYIHSASGHDSLHVVGTDTTRYFADAHGRDTLVMDPMGAAHNVHRTYDPTTGNLASITHPGGRTVTYTYDGYGRATQRQFGIRPADTITYDAINRVTRRTSGGHGATTYGYGPVYRRTIRDAHGQTTTDSINALGWVVQRTDALGKVSAYQHSTDGELTGATDRRSLATTRTYDPAHRLLTRVGTSMAPDSFYYDSTGRTRSAWNAVSKDQIYRAASGWIDSSITTFAGVRFKRSYHPTANMQLDSSTVTASNGLVFSVRKYYWNTTTGKIDSARINGRMMRYKYSTEGRLVLATFGTRDSMAATWTTNHQLRQLQFTGSTAITNAFSRGYGYDSTGLMAEEDLAPTFGADTTQQIVAFNHDSAGQLVAASYRTILGGCPSGDQSPDLGSDCVVAGGTTTEALHYAYDSVANITQRADSTSAGKTVMNETYSTGDRLVAFGTAVDSADLEGNRIVHNVGSSHKRYHFNAAGLLDSVVSGSTVLTYDYNAYGRVVRRSRNGVAERYFLWGHGGHLLAELDGTASHRLAEYIYLPNTQHPLAIIGSDTSEFNYVAYDGRGDVTGTFTDAGSVSQTITYDPWGAQRSVTGTVGDTNRVRFKGALWEGDSTQLYYVGRRWYDASCSRFVNEAGRRRGTAYNPYTYATNSPLIVRKRPIQRNSVMFSSTSARPRLGAMAGDEGTVDDGSGGSCFREWVLVTAAAAGVVAACGSVPETATLTTPACIGAVLTYEAAEGDLLICQQEQNPPKVDNPSDSGPTLATNDPGDDDGNSNSADNGDGSDDGSNNGVDNGDDGTGSGTDAAGSGDDGSGDDGGSASGDSSGSGDSGGSGDAGSGDGGDGGGGGRDDLRDGGEDY